MQINDKIIVPASVRVMREEDYDKVYRLWKTIKGFGIRSMDDSREGIARFIQRNPTTSIGSRELENLWQSWPCVHCRRNISIKYA